MLKSLGGLIAGGQVIFSWPCLEERNRWGLLTFNITCHWEGT